MDENVSPSAYGDTWYAATRVEAPERPTLNVDLDVDVCVIGGGLAGLTTAREVARGGWSVVLLEAGRLAANASGRNTGFVLPGFAAMPETIIGRVGLERAKDLWALSQSGLDYVRAAIAADAMPGIDPQDGWLHVSKTNNGDELVKQVGLLGEFGAEIEGWPVERVRAGYAANDISTPFIFRAPSTSTRSTMRSALPPPPSATAPVSSRTRRLCRSIRRACANVSSLRTRGCAPTTSCCAEIFKSAS